MSAQVSPAGPEHRPPDGVAANWVEQPVEYARPDVARWWKAAGNRGCAVVELDHASQKPYLLTLESANPGLSENESTVQARFANHAAAQRWADKNVDHVGGWLPVEHQPPNEQVSGFQDAVRAVVDERPEIPPDPPGVERLNMPDVVDSVRLLGDARALRRVADRLERMAERAGKRP